MFELSIVDTLLLSLFIFIAGFVDSIAGGGGLISVPAYFAFGLPAHVALGTNKFSSFMGTLTAVFRYYKAGAVKLRVGLWAAIGALFGSALGAKIALLVSEKAIQSILIVLVPAILIFLFVKDRVLPHRKETSGEDTKHLSLKSFMIGALIGTYDGFFGPGTGTFLTIGFYTFLNLNLINSSANARLANLASNAGSLVIFLIHSKVLFPLAIIPGAAGIAGNQFGSSLALKRGDKVIKPFMALVLVLLLAEVIRKRFLEG